MVQHGINQRKNLAMSLRRGGYSYSEIQKFVSVPKATLSYWFKDIKLSEAQLVRLQKKRNDAIQEGAQIRSKRVNEAIEKIERTSAKDIKDISKRELWLMGVMLYWRERVSDRDVKKGVKFTSSDPHLIRLFLKWLMEVGQLGEADVLCDILIEGDKDLPAGRQEKAISYWSEVTSFPQTVFTRVYVQKTKKKRKKRETKKAEFGLLRIRVKASSMLARQLSGWIMAIQNKI
ncbi:MAG: hypothetical protein A2735_00375 [Candidatus Yanofskybacteria bacterium RIFCSPHIGHO2_01_FULL_41_21]|uniref:Uncharacterized protein n=1 Tax=Candidatus Yanofskybacteria bacterium RIFCSPHIGHO2_01_FULL_41_21 TaxID=1802660 RepID=A0A1F8ECV2_9BACT|nr:MAG: hypothetical protein A2735_00375 [Candidatus Yanofskybacteria bacterium RIFCSPHIGHO2_01_FULL_41_21]